LVDKENQGIIATNISNSRDINGTDQHTQISQTEINRVKFAPIIDAFEQNIRSLLPDELKNSLVSPELYFI
jgi:hypothetical protein